MAKLSSGVDRKEDWLIHKAFHTHLPVFLLPRLFFYSVHAWAERVQPVSFGMSHGRPSACLMNLHCTLSLQYAEAIPLPCIYLRWLDSIYN